MTEQPPPAQGRRLDWSQLPAHLLSALEDWLSSHVVAATTQPGGFSPAIAVRVRAEDGRRVFVKAVGPGPNPDAADIYRREHRVVAALPRVPMVPELLWARDEGEDGWIVLVFEDIDGANPQTPWRDQDLRRVLNALERLSRLLTPSPIRIRTASQMVTSHINGWQRLLDEPNDSLDDWSKRHLTKLVELESKASEAVDGNTLLHFDVQADNLLLTDDQVYVVDWPHASVGAAWVDAALFAPSVTMQGGPQPEELLAQYGQTEQVGPDAVTALVAALAGYFTERGLQPPPPGIPGLREFQAAQGAVARSWLSQRTSWD